jgi:PAT family beta-lactamase induction signal transducer AmpG
VDHGLRSATHDISADGFYMLGLRQQQQAAFVGVRSTFYRLATLAGQGPLVILAGTLATSLGDVHQAWAIVFFVLAGLFFALFAWHQAVLPRPTPTTRRPKGATRCAPSWPPSAASSASATSG